MKENRGTRLKSKVQSYDIRDSETYAGVLEIEQLLRTQMAQDSRAVDIAEVFRDIVKKAGEESDSINTDDSLLSEEEEENGDVRGSAVNIHDLVDDP